MPVVLGSTPDRFLDLAEPAAPPVAALSVQILRSLEELDAFAQEWDALSRHRGFSPFQSFGWTRGWFARYAESYHEMAVFVLLRGATPCVILPLYRRGSALRLAGDNLGWSPDALVLQHEAVALALDAVLDWAQRRHCHLELRSLQANGPLQSMLEHKPNRWRGHLHFHRSEPRRYYGMPPSVEDLYGPLPQHERDRLRRGFRRLERDFPELGFCCKTSGAMEDGSLGEVLDLRSEEDAEALGLFQDKRFAALLLDLALAESCGLRLATVRSKQGDLLAAEAGLSGAGHFQSLFRVIRGALGKYHLGDWMLLKLVDWLRRWDRVETLGFAEADERSFLWQADRIRQVADFYLYPPGPLNLARWAGVHAGHNTLRMSRQLLQRAGVYRPMI